MGREDVWVRECCWIFRVSSAQIIPRANDELTVSGNLDLQPVLPFLGKTQLQILSFITSAILLGCHACTSWAVTERVLLRDESAYDMPFSARVADISVDRNPRADYLQD